MKIRRSPLRAVVRLLIALSLLTVSALPAHSRNHDRRVIPGLPVPGVNVPVPVPVPVVVVPVPAPTVVIEKKSPPVVVKTYRDQGRDRDYHGRKWSKHNRNHGRVYHTLPENVITLHHGGGLFYYHFGTFYRHTGQGYVVVEAPIGARVRILPDECSSLIIGHSHYFLCDDVYYERSGDEYVVLDGPPRGWHPPEANVGEEVWVDTDTLNLRAGPGRRYDVVGQLLRGDVVEVRGMEGDWYSVRREDGAYGWIMKEYARPYRHRLQGDG